MVIILSLNEFLTLTIANQSFHMTHLLMMVHHQKHSEAWLFKKRKKKKINSCSKDSLNRILLGMVNHCCDLDRK